MSVHAATKCVSAVLASLFPARCCASTSDRQIISPAAPEASREHDKGPLRLRQRPTSEKGNCILASRTFNRGFLPFFLFEKKRKKPVQTEGTAAWKMGVRERTARAWRVPGFFSVRVVCCRVRQFLTRARSALDIYRLCSVLDQSCRHAVHSGLGVGIHSMRPVPTGGHVR